MAKRKSFEAVADIDDLTDKLGEHQRLSSTACVGERLAAMILSKNRRDLIEAQKKLGNEGANEGLDWLFAAHESLSMRLAFVDLALERLNDIGEDFKQGGVHA